MEKSFTLIQTAVTAGFFSVVSFWYGFMFGSEPACKELGTLIQQLQDSNKSDSASPPSS